ncbi:hypothetical protein QBC43DRAFT_217865 [Cladorrhinum sp. PSN259]|nr:hypothetical protein QBC43DRAFT_217865 [Cladorrhinum sp. PSN259]
MAQSNPTEALRVQDQIGLPPAYTEANLNQDEDDLPPYTEQKPISPDDSIPPATYIILGLEVHNYPPSPDAPPCYKLTRAIHSIGPATQTIDISRVDSQIRVSPRTGRQVYTKREKELYTLQHQRPNMYAPVFYAGGQPHGSTRTLGEMRIEKAPVFHHGYRVIKVIKEEEKARLQRKGEKVKEGYRWSLREIDHGSGWEWRNEKDVVVARQITEPVDGEKEQHRLEVVIDLPRRTVDSLVSMWCLWMWHLHVENNAPKKTWADRKKILERKNPTMPMGGKLWR